MKKVFDSKLQESPRLLPHEWFNTLADYTKDSDTVFDFYGTGEVIENFETKLAKFLGTESAVFMPSGTMAQQIALKIASKVDKKVGFHPLSHLEIHEQKAYKELHNLDVILIGKKIIT